MKNKKLYIHPEIPTLPHINHSTLSEVQLGFFLSDVIECQEGITVNSMKDVSHREKRVEIKGKLLEVTMYLPENSFWSTDKKVMELTAKLFIPADHYEYCYFTEYAMGNGELLS
jgi:hypothetical protein